MATLSISEFYAGERLLVTGATGFMGKVLIEKILRSCPDVDTIYILVRSKKGKSPQERWSHVTEQNVRAINPYPSILCSQKGVTLTLKFMAQVFDRLKKERPLALNKIKLVEGDTTCKNLNLNRKDRQVR